MIEKPMFRNSKIIFAILTLVTIIAGVVNLFPNPIPELYKWDGVKTQTLSNQKFIFLECYTKSCIWCIRMEHETLQDTTVCRFMDSNFISYKINCNDSLGRICSSKFRVRAYTTYLIFNPHGKLISKFGGYSNPKEFLNKLNKSIKQTQNHDYSGVSENLDLNIPAIFDVHDPDQIDSSALKTYLDSQNNLLSETNWTLIYFFHLDSVYNAFFLDHYEKYSELYSKYETDIKLWSIFSDIFEEAMEKDSPFSLSKIDYYIDKFKIENAAVEKLKFRLEYCSDKDSVPGIADNLEKILSIKDFSEAISYITINKMALKICDSQNDYRPIKGLMEYYETIIRENSDSNILYAYSYLNYRMRFNDVAGEYAEKALQMAMEQKNDIRGIRDLIKKIEQSGR